MIGLLKTIEVFLLTFLGLLFLVFNFGKAVLVKTFAQIGPTCGYYSFVQALYEAGYIDGRERWPVVYDILSEDFANNNSMVGEIFDVRHFVELAECDAIKNRKIFPKVELIKLNEKVDLIKLLKESWVIYPVLRGLTPHYCLVAIEKNRICMHYNWMPQKGELQDADKLYKSNMELKNYNYNWKNFYSVKKEVRDTVFKFFEKPVIMLMARKQEQQIARRKKMMKNSLKNTVTQVNMAGYVVCIHKCD